MYIYKIILAPFPPFVCLWTLLYIYANELPCAPLLSSPHKCFSKIVIYNSDIVSDFEKRERVKKA